MGLQAVGFNLLGNQLNITGWMTWEYMHFDVPFAIQTLHKPSKSVPHHHDRWPRAYRGQGVQ